jgi:hypothetical protein
VDDAPTDLPHLLRRVADHIEALDIQPMELLDVTVRSYIEEDGPHWAVTVHWSPDEPQESA